MTRRTPAHGAHAVVILALTSVAAVAAARPMGSGEPAQLLLQGNNAYDVGEYDKAVKLYSSLVRGGARNGHLYYNLGNAELRAGHVGRAVAAFRQASLLLPREQDVRANLAFARKLGKDAIAPPEPSPVLRTLFFWHYSLSERELLFVLAGVSLLFWAVLAMRLFGRRSEVLRWTAAALLLLLLATGASYVVHLLRPARLAVVDRAEINVHSGTSRDTVVRFKLHEGAEAEVVDSERDWVRVVLQDGKQGWVARDDLLLIAQPPAP